ncbi:MAG TPA: Tim44-like domain-containing protein [Kineosporiaceae bacterium]|nr:Tim44-like domain-containing protein [Kineosporiaceae bacterium]
MGPMRIRGTAASSTTRSPLTRLLLPAGLLTAALLLPASTLAVTAPASAAERASAAVTLAASASSAAKLTRPAVLPGRGGGGSGGGHSSGGGSRGSGGSSSHSGSSHSGSSSSGSGSSSGGSSSSTTRHLTSTGYSSGVGGAGLGAGVGLVVGLIALVVLVAVIVLIVRRRRSSGAFPQELYPDPELRDLSTLRPADDLPTPQSLGAGFAEVGRATTRAELDEGLAEIRAHDPEFDLDNFRTAAQRTFFTVQQAWTQRHPVLSRQVMADSLWQAHKMQIEAQQREGTANRLDGLAVQNIVIVGMNSDNGYDSIMTRFFASSADYTVDGSGRFVRGHSDVQDWCEDWVFQRSASAVTRQDGGLLASKCPHCGAPLQLDLAGVCSYCRNTAVDGGDWVLTRIDQLPSWEWALTHLPS